MDGTGSERSMNDRPHAVEAEKDDLPAVSVEKLNRYMYIFLHTTNTVVGV